VLALIRIERRQPSDARTHADDALAIAREAGIAETWAAGTAFLALAATYAAEGRWREAEREGERGELLRRGLEASVAHAHALIVLAEIRASRGRVARASIDLAHAREQISGFRDAGRLGLLADRVDRVLDEAGARVEAPLLTEPPSLAELNVLRLLATELSQREIGAELFLSLNTVKTHTRALYRKLGATSRQDALARASALGLVGERDSPG